MAVSTCVKCGIRVRVEGDRPHRVALEVVFRAMFSMRGRCRRVDNQSIGGCFDDETKHSGTFRNREASQMPLATGS